jgi:hypothetical protein
MQYVGSSNGTQAVANMPQNRREKFGNRPLGCATQIWVRPGDMRSSDCCKTIFLARRNRTAKLLKFKVVDVQFHRANIFFQMLDL